MEKILIVEDDDVVRNELSLVLTKNNYDVLMTTDFENILDFVLGNNPNLILLDINLPHTDGFDICKKLREKVKIPIIFVTSRNTDIDELKSITLGGDDFITKPYNLPILLARISSILKRSNPDYNKDLIVKGVKLNTHLGQVEYEGEIASLTKNEFRILYYLFMHAGSLVTKDELTEYLWNNKLYVDENILSVNITRIRKKLSDIGLTDFIETVHGKGYSL